MRLDELEFLSLLGEGTYGKVFKVIEKRTKKVYALKVLDKTYVETQYKSFLPVYQEKEILRFVKSCEQVITMRASFQDGNKIYLLTEYVDGNTLEEYINEHGKLDSCIVQHIVKQIVEFLLYLKKCGIYHGDIKPSNIMLLANYKIKVLDFGCAGLFIQNKLNSELWKKIEQFKEAMPIKELTNFTGTISYISPEYLSDENLVKTWEDDLWALGVVTFYLLTGKEPFYDENNFLVYDKISAIRYKMPDVKVTLIQGTH